MPMTYTSTLRDLLQPAGRARDLVAHVERCLADSTSQLSDEVLQLEGFSGDMTRHFYNNVCALRMPGGRETRYLEIGTWKGSSLVSALFANHHVHATVIDNWSQFGGPKQDFMAAVSRLVPRAHLDIVDQCCFEVDPAALVSDGCKYDVYLYDGEHSRESQRRAITHYASALNEEAAIVLIDDWNWPDVRYGTLEGIRDAGLHIEYQHEIRHTLDDTHTDDETARRQFWNGIGIFVLKKDEIPPCGIDDRL